MKGVEEQEGDRPLPALMKEREINEEDVGEDEEDKKEEEEDDEEDEEEEEVDTSRSREGGRPEGMGSMEPSVSPSRGWILSMLMIRAWAQILAR